MHSLWLHLAFLCGIYHYVVAAPTKVQSCQRTPNLSNGFFEGDMIVSFSRNGDPEPANYWPNGVVYYKIDNGFDENQLKNITTAMNMIQEVSCIIFKEATNKQKDYFFVNKQNKGCYANLGKMGGEQPLNLENGCTSLNIIQHELLHTLGFWHQQSSEDRDKYVRIVWDNIKKGEENNFCLKTGSLDFGVPYDYRSIMHYYFDALAKTKGLVTIETLDPEYAKKIGTYENLSDGDVIKLKKMYSCPS